MCQFLSGFGTKTGDIICNPVIDSHSELEYYYRINDNYIQHSFKWEYTPKQGKTIFDIKDYVFKVDEDREPKWLTSELKETIEYKAHQKLLSIYHKDEKDLRLLNEVAILDNCEVGSIKGTVIKAMRNSSVAKMLENSSVAEMWGNSSVAKMLGNSSVAKMLENSSVAKMLGNSSVAKMLENSSVAEMWENSSVAEMWGNSSVKWKSEQNLLNTATKK